ncbi:uncharacterized protein HD556DRAFT_1447150 [Suillus plorans]|uniref:Uncharacterized protein n=1 Tax=Suillus plorans TaxID=116603 RepID=A0A9P7AGX8_9AGAM|nr:uncharacterized protein HD556DRAFT_1447150 [Suillus plorans]KAG1789301.1 hypothetical protein HD556DRAFT_1447150 [Suillus plorans]
MSAEFACGKLLGRRILRGALTNGFEWIFLIMMFADDYNGASLHRSRRLCRDTLGAHTWHDLIAAILAYWTDLSPNGEELWFIALQPWEIMIGLQWTRGPNGKS